MTTAPTLQIDHLETPLGTLAIVADDDGRLAVLRWTDGHAREERALRRVTLAPASNRGGLTAALRPYFDFGISKLLASHSTATVSHETSPLPISDVEQLILRPQPKWKTPLRQARGVERRKCTRPFFGLPRSPPIRQGCGSYSGARSFPEVIASPHESVPSAFGALRFAPKGVVVTTSDGVDGRVWDDSAALP